MNKRNVIIAVIIIATICICLSIKIYDTNSKYGMPKEKWYGVGEGFEYLGVEYKLKDTEIIDENIFKEKFGAAGDSFDNTNLLRGIEKKYFLMTFDIKVLNEEYDFELANIAHYTKYQSAYSGEFMMTLSINDKKLQRKELTVGDSVEYYVVFSVSEHFYTKEGLANLKPEYIAMVIYDTENQVINYMCKGERLDTNID